MSFDPVYLSLGTNMGDRIAHLCQARKEIESVVGKLISLSPIYETEPWGNKAQGFFLNQVIRVRTDLPPEQLITELLGIEHRMGRKRTIKNAPRVIDLDILFFMDQIIERDHLTIPHEKIADRRFILAPMAKLDPDFRHPVLHQTMIQLLERCSDPSSVIKIQRHEKTS